MSIDDLAVAIRDAFENTHPTEHVAFEDPDAPVYGQISGWFNLTQIAATVQAILAAKTPPPAGELVQAFIAQRPEYIKAMRETPGDQDQSDYWRWSGHAEARRQLADKLGVNYL